MSKTGRNHHCPCGSGRKYKHCCLRKGQEVGASNLTVIQGNHYRSLEFVRATTVSDIWAMRAPVA